METQAFYDGIILILILYLHLVDNSDAWHKKRVPLDAGPFSLLLIEKLQTVNYYLIIITLNDSA